MSGELSVSFICHYSWPLSVHVRCVSIDVVMAILHIAIRFPLPHSGHSCSQYVMRARSLWSKYITIVKQIESIYV